MGRFEFRLTNHLIATLRDARTALSAIATADPVEAAVARRLTREIDDAIARLSGGQAEKDLVSIVCHDLKDPLASIVMGAGFLKKTIPAEEGGARRVIEAISRSADRMGQVVADFHDLAKIEGGLLPVERHPCDVVATLQGALPALEAQAKEARISLTLEVPTDHPIASCDRARLVQMVAKLVGNALRFTPAEGRIVVKVRAGAADAADADKEWVRISVQDTGRGIPPDRIPTIFDRTANARRTPRDGPGLGLAIVRGLADLHGGEISVESRMGEGTTFTFTLPRA
jgi:chemotaxis family two-component system sensor kinase Cph1